MKRLILILVILGSTSCATLTPKPSSELTQIVQAKFYATYAIKDLDVVRDLADDASKTSPPLISHATLLKIVDWHEHSVKIIHATPNGWQATTLAALDELQTALAPADYAKFRPAIEAAKTFAKESK